MSESDGFVSERTAQATGSRVQIWDNRDGMFDRDDSNDWFTVCVPHGAVCSHETLRLAKSFSRDPREWCEWCRAEVERQARNAQPLSYENTRDQDIQAECRQAPTYTDGQLLASRFSDGAPFTYRQGEGTFASQHARPWGIPSPRAQEMIEYRQAEFKKVWG